MVRDVDLKDTEVNKEDNNEDIEISEYRVIFNSNGGSSVSPVTVKEGEVLVKPEDPTRDGYKFLNWTLDDKEYDFENVVTSNLVLKANWEKKKTSSTTTTTTTTKPSNNTSNKKVASTIDKINLNDYPTVSIDYTNFRRPTGYYFINNLGDIFPNLAGKSRIELSWEEDDPASQGLDLRINEWYAAFDKLEFDINKENNAKTILNNIKNKTYKGVIFSTSVGSPYPSHNENHAVSYQYEYITVSEKAFPTLYNQMKSVRNGLDKEISSALNGSITVVFPGSGEYGKYEAGLLSEKLCEEYNLVCDRW